MKVKYTHKNMLIRLTVINVTDVGAVIHEASL